MTKENKKGAERSLKSTAVDNLEIEIKKVLSKPHKVIDKPELISPYISSLNHIFRNMEHSIQVVHDGSYNGFIFIAWIENNKLFTKIIKL